jgi:hypothetical protein
MRVFEVKQESDEERLVQVGDLSVDSPIQSIKINSACSSVLLGLASGSLLNIDLADYTILHDFPSTTNNEISSIQLLSENVAVTSGLDGVITFYDLG